MKYYIENNQNFISRFNLNIASSKYASTKLHYLLQNVRECVAQVFRANLAQEIQNADTIFARLAFFNWSRHISLATEISVEAVTVCVLIFLFYPMHGNLIRWKSAVSTSFRKSSYCGLSKCIYIDQ